MASLGKVELKSHQVGSHIPDVGLLLDPQPLGRFYDIPTDSVNPTLHKPDGAGQFLFPDLRRVY